MATLNQRSPSRPYSSGADSVGSNQTPDKRTSKPGLPSASGGRLPRDGPVKGGGTMRVHDTFSLETHKCDLDPYLPAPLAGLGSPRRGSSYSGHKSKSDKKKDKGSATGSAMEAGGQSPVYQTGGRESTSDSPRSSNFQKDKGGKEKPRLSPEERKRMEIYSKWEKTEGLRERDHKLIVEVIDRQHEMRDARFKRLLEAITGRDNLAYKTAIALREREQHAEDRRRELYASWDEHVYQPIATQAFEHLNPPNRAMEQKLAGSKSVQFNLPGQVFRLVANVHNDPARKPVVDLAKENAFHVAATNVLRSSQSAPSLRAPLNRNAPRPSVFSLGNNAPMPEASGPGSSSVVPRALSRPVLEPTIWGQVEIQGLMYGHFAQVAEHGSGFQRGKKGGPDVFVPDDSDGVLPCGTRHSRMFGYNDVGILRGDSAAQGEASNFKRQDGMSSIAPMQDHFLFDSSKEVTDLEFPLGKKIFPEYHSG